MKTGIELTPDAFNCLVEQLPKGSTIHTACHHVEIIHIPDEPPKFVLKCTDEEIQALLEIAKEHCPEAVRQIEDGLLKSAQRKRG